MLIGSAVLSILLEQNGLPWWAWVGPALLLVAGAVLAVPIRVAADATSHDRPEPQRHPSSAFIRGDVTNSKLQRIDSDADVFIDGNVRDTTIFGIIFRGNRES